MAMKVVEVNVGEKIPYTVSKTKVTFDDELMLNLCLLYTSPSPRDRG